MKKIKSLEGLRGIAAFVVVLYHFLGQYYPSLVNGTPNQIMTYSGVELKIATTPFNVLYNGDYAVYIFFVLSGFVLSYKFYQTGDPKAITSSAFKRYFRLVIPVIFSVMCFYVLYTLQLPYGPKNKIADFGLFDAIYEGLFGVFFREGSSSYNPVLWTMYFEFFGSFLVFGLCLIVVKNRNRFWIYLLFIFILWNSNFLAFLIGMMICDYKSSGLNIHNKFLKLGLLLVALFLGSYPHAIGRLEGAVTINETMYSFLYFGDSSGRFYHTIGAGLLLLVLINSKTLDKFLSIKPFQFLGFISFSMYVIHFAVLKFFTFFVYHSVGEVFPILTHKYKFFVSFSASIIIILIVSYLMAKYIDMGGVKLANKIYNKFFADLKVKTKVDQQNLKT